MNRRSLLQSLLGCFVLPFINIKDRNTECGLVENKDFEPVTYGFRCGDSNVFRVWTDGPPISIGDFVYFGKDGKLYPGKRKRDPIAGYAISNTSEDNLVDIVLKGII